MSFEKFIPRFEKLIIPRLENDFKQRYKDFLISFESFKEVLEPWGNFNYIVDQFFKHSELIRLPNFPTVSIVAMFNHYTQYYEEILYKVSFQAVSHSSHEKKFFELLSFSFSFIEICYRYFILVKYLGAMIHANLPSSVIKSNKLLEEILLSEEAIEILYNDAFLENLDTILKPLNSQKLDFTGSGQILISILINDKDFLNFSGVQLNEKENLLSGYDKLLSVFQEKYDSGNLSYLNIFFNQFPPLIERYLRGIIFSRKRLKTDLMVKGYSGTVYASSNKIKKVITDFFNFNCYSLTLEQYKIIAQISNLLANEFNILIKEYCPSISEKYLKLIKSLASDFEIFNRDNKGFIVSTEYFKYKINPKLHERYILKLMKLKNKKKFERSSRREVSFFLDEINFKKIKTKLGPNLIHTLDALLVYFIRRIFTFLNSTCNIGSIFDCFIFNGIIGYSMFRNVSKCAMMLAFQENFVHNLVKENKIPQTDFYKSFNINIFNAFKNDALCEIFKSEFLYFLFKNWDKEGLHSGVMFRSLKYMNKTEKKSYKSFMEGKLIRKQRETEKLSNKESFYTKQYIATQLKETIMILQDNFVKVTSNSTISRLNKILDNDNILK